jgi:hypothetical protein
MDEIDKEALTSFPAANRLLQRLLDAASPSGSRILRQRLRLQPPSARKKTCAEKKTYNGSFAMQWAEGRRLRSALVAARSPRREVSNRSPTACERDEGCQPKKP